MTGADLTTDIYSLNEACFDQGCFRELQTACTANSTSGTGTATMPWSRMIKCEQRYLGGKRVSSVVSVSSILQYPDLVMAVREAEGLRHTDCWFSGTAQVRHP